MTRCYFPELPEGSMTWGEFVVYSESVAISLGDCGARILYIDEN